MGISGRKGPRDVRGVPRLLFNKLDLRVSSSSRQPFGRSRIRLDAHHLSVRQLRREGTRWATVDRVAIRIRAGLSCRLRRRPIAPKHSTQQPSVQNFHLQAPFGRPGIQRRPGFGGCATSIRMAGRDESRFRWATCQAVFRWLQAAAAIRTVARTPTATDCGDRAGCRRLAPCRVSTIPPCHRRRCFDDPA